jgi:hypothetical protein
LDILPYFRRAWFSLNDEKGIQGVYYKKERKTAVGPVVMYAARVCAKGVTDLYFVLPATKDDRWFFINSILKPIVEKDISRLYSGEEHNVVLHFDSAGSHTTMEVYSWLDERNVKYIWREEWLSNSPDLSPMGFGPNEIFQQILFGKKASRLDGLKVGCASSLCGFPFRNLCQHHKVLAWSCEKDDKKSGLSDRKLKTIIFLSLAPKEFSQNIGSTLLAHSLYIHFT